MRIISVMMRHWHCEAVFPNNMSGVARVALAGGSSFEEMVVTPKGEPDNFLSTDEMLGKFNTLVAPYLAESQRTLLSDTLLTLNGKTDTKGLLGLTRPLSGDGFKVAQVAG